MHLAWRWFTGLGFDQEVPNHSTFSKNRHGRFQESKVFEQLFEEVVAQCLSVGLVRGDQLSVDGTFVEANASKESRIPREQLAEVAQVNRTVREYLAELEIQNPVEEPTHNEDKVSTTDPDSTYATKGGTSARMGYYNNYVALPDCIRWVTSPNCSRSTRRSATVSGPASARQRTHSAGTAAGSCADQFTGTRPSAIGAVETAEDDPRSGLHHRADLGPGDRRLQPLPIGEGSHHYGGLCSAEKSSADKVMRMPISKQRNKHVQHVLVEAAKLAPRCCHELALLREKEIQRGNKNRATLAVARKLVAYMLAVDGRKQDFVPAEELAGKAVA
jgi:Transposase and inactivated derivatives